MDYKKTPIFKNSQEHEDYYRNSYLKVIDKYHQREATWIVDMDSVWSFNRELDKN